MARPWNKVIEADDEERPLLENVCFVLCRPQGPQNIGGIARVMNNFGVHDLRIVSPMPTAGLYSSTVPPFAAQLEPSQLCASIRVCACVGVRVAA